MRRLIFATGVHFEYAGLGPAGLARRVLLPRVGIRRRQHGRRRQRQRGSLISPVLIAAGACLMVTCNWAMAAQREVDLELVLAADISTSMDLEEAALQRRGFALAIRHPRVIEAIQSGPLGRIAIRRRHRHQRPAHRQRSSRTHLRLPGAAQSRPLLRGLRHRRPRLIHHRRRWLQGLRPRHPKKDAAGDCRHGAPRPLAATRHRKASSTLRCG